MDITIKSGVQKTVRTQTTPGNLNTQMIMLQPKKSEREKANQKSHALILGCNQKGENLNLQRM